ncbi:putative membrane protein [Helicobacter pylori R32b]|nr:putative membrane protein [Helicobacter pylori R32b]
MLAFNQAFLFLSVLLGGSIPLFGYWIRVLGLFLKWGLKG